LDLVANETCRAPCQQATARLLEDIAEEIFRFGHAQSIVETRAVRDSSFGHSPDRFEDEINSAELKEATMAVLMSRCPGEE
jgi:hypothetical protein